MKRIYDTGLLNSCHLKSMVRIIIKSLTSQSSIQEHPTLVYHQQTAELYTTKSLINTVRNLEFVRRIKLMDHYNVIVAFQDHMMIS